MKKIETLPGTGGLGGAGDVCVLVKGTDSEARLLNVTLTALNCLDYLGFVTLLLGASVSSSFRWK